MGPIAFNEKECEKKGGGEGMREFEISVFEGTKLNH